MANEEVLGPRKTMLVLVIVVGCFAVLWPRILSPLLMGPSREQLKPNQFDREAGCCEVLFDKDMAVLELINEVCNSAVHSNGKLTPYSAAECRKAVNDTCGLDLAAFLKRNENFGKTSKMLVETMKNSNSSCLKENFGVHVWSLGVHQSQNAWLQPDTVKQERPAIRGAGPHPALRERGRAIPPGAPATTRTVVPMPPHARVRSSPLSVYYELDIKPPPIPGMRPPLGSPGGPVPAPKSSMGFVMPIYTICIIVFFVYTLSKVLFKRTGSSPYETVTPDPQFRRRVFRDDSRTSPDKLVVTAISGLVAEVQQQMEASYAQNQQRQDVQQDNHTRPYTNGTVLHNSGPVHIVASEYREPAKEKSPEPRKEKESSPVPEESPETKQTEETKQTKSEVIETKEAVPEQQKESTPEREPTPVPKEINTVKGKEYSPETDYIPEFKKETTPGLEKEPSPEKQEEPTSDDGEEVEVSEKESSEEPEIVEKADELIKLDDAKLQKNDDIRKTEEFLKEETKDAEEKEKQSTPELLDEAIKDNNEEGEEENASVKVVGMEVTAHVANGGAWKRSGADLSGAKLPLAKDPPPARHEAEQVQSIYLETEIPQQSRVLVADFAENTTDKPTQAKHSPMVVSGKMTLSLIQDPPRETPERDLESTVDSDFTTASGVTDNPENEDAESENEDAESDNENAENLFAQHVEGDIIYEEGALAAIVSDGDSDVEEGEVIDLESGEEFEEEVEEEIEEEIEEEEEVPTQQKAKK